MFHADSCFIEPSESYMNKKIKASQKVHDGFCVEMCIPQPMYRGTGEPCEWGQIGFDEMKVTCGVGVNAKSDVMGGITNDFLISTGL